MMKYTFLLCLLPLFSNAQVLRRTGEMTRFSIEMNYGKISSFMNYEDYCFDCCDFGCGANLVYNDPISTPYFSLKTIFHLNENHRFGFGIAFSQKGRKEVNYRQAFDYYYSNPIHEGYFGLILSHEMTLLHGHFVSFGFCNELHGDYTGNDFSYSYLKKYGLSHQGKLVFGFHASKHFELKLNAVTQTAIMGYGSNLFDGPYHRFGYGLLLGMDYRFGKLKYRSLQKQ